MRKRITKVTTKTGRTVSENDPDGHLREIITVVTNTRNILWLQKFLKMEKKGLH